MLKIDCSKCSGLCCVALYYSECDGFPEDKSAGKPCNNLLPSFNCSIHTELKRCCLKGCMAYDCFGAGEKVTSEIYGGKTWQSNPELAEEIFDVFHAVFQLNQMLWYLAEAESLVLDLALKSEIISLEQENIKATSLSPKEILCFNIVEYKARVNKILMQITQERAIAKEKNHDYMGHNFKNANLNGRDFSMSLLIAANLGNCSLKGTNLLGADMRDANIRNADLSDSLFVTQMQINTAIGNNETKLPPNITKPTAWQ